MPSRVLGISSDAGREDAEKAYAYLTGVWDPRNFGSDAIARKKAEARMEQINAAYAALMTTLPAAETASSPSRLPIYAGGGAAVILVMVLISFLLIKEDSGKNMTPSIPQATAPAAAPEMPKPLPAPADTSPGESGSQPQPKPVPGPAMTESEAIEYVKQSKALDRLFSVESILSRWTKENETKFKVIGWSSSKAEDGSFLVSYTVLEGDRTRGFYFDLNTATGSVQNIARNPDLQKKHNILPAQ